MISPDQSPKNYSRREVLKMFAVAGAGLAIRGLELATKPVPVTRAANLSPMESSSRTSSLEARYPVREIAYEPGRGMVQSFPWLPSWEGREGSDAMGGPALDKLDLVFERFYGISARDAYGGESSREHMMADHAKNLQDPPGSEAWSGYCYVGALTTSESMPIMDDKEVLGVPFSKRERMQIAVMNNFRHPRQEINPNDLGGLWDRFANRGIIIANWSRSADPNEKWWGYVRWIEKETGLVHMTRHQKWQEPDGWYSEFAHVSELKAAYQAYPSSHLGSGSFLDPTVASLVTGVLEIAA